MNMEEGAVRNITTLDDLLHWLIMFNDGQQELQLCFLLGYRIFYSAAEIVSSLESMGKKLVKNNQTGGDALKFNRFATLWITKLFNLDLKKTTILPLLFEVIKMTMPTEEYTTLKNSCLRDMSARRGNQHLVHHSAGFTKPQLEARSPKIIMSVLGYSRPRSMGLDLTREWSLVSVTVLVEQITLIEYEYFSAVHPDEFLKQSWSTATREATAPRLSFLVKRFNEMGYWVATQILTTPTAKQQSKMMRRFIKIAKRLYEIHNFNSMMQILSGLQNMSVIRLRQAWRGLKTHTRETFEELVLFMSSSQNFQKYREEMDRYCTKKAAIPYIVVFMRDMTFSEEISDRTEQGRTNFSKVLRIGKQLLWFKHFTELSYDFQMDMNIQKVMQDLKVLTEEELYQLSLVCEPRTPSGEDILSPRRESHGRKSLSLDFFRTWGHSSSARSPLSPRLDEKTEGRKSEKFDLAEKMEKIERVEKAEKLEKLEKNEKTENTEKTEKTDKKDKKEKEREKKEKKLRSEKSERLGRNSKTKVVRVEKLDLEKLEKLDKK